MSTRLRLVWLALGLGTFVTLVVLFFLPADWEIERTAVIDAPPEEVFALVADLEQWERWSPWRQADYEGLEFQYPGPRAGVGAVRTWDTERLGTGRLEIVAVERPHRVVWETALQDGDVTTRDEVRLEPLTDAGLDRTRVLWEHRGSLGRTLLGRLSLPVIEASMSRDIERGLAGLENVAGNPS